MTNTTNTARIEALANTQLHHATKGKAAKLAAMLDAEYPAIQLVPRFNDDETKVVGWDAKWFGPISYTPDDGSDKATYVTEDGLDLLESDKLPELADLISACEEQDLDPEAIDAPEKPSGSVVDETYRRQYRESSTTGQSCGDWLAEWLAGKTLVGGKLDVEAFDAILNANSVDLTKPWARAKESGTRGWQGRYRMNGRQVMEKIVAKHGWVNDEEGQPVTVPDDAIAVLRDRHAKWLAKEVKREEAEQAAADAAAGKEA